MPREQPMTFALVWSDPGALAGILADGHQPRARVGAAMCEPELDLALACLAGDELAPTRYQRVWPIMWVRGEVDSDAW